MNTPVVPIINLFFSFLIPHLKINLVWPVFSKPQLTSAGENSSFIEDMTLPDGCASTH